MRFGTAWGLPREQGARRTDATSVTQRGIKTTKETREEKRRERERERGHTILRRTKMAYGTKHAGTRLRFRTITASDKTYRPTCEASPPSKKPRITVTLVRILGILHGRSYMTHGGLSATGAGRFVSVQRKPEQAARRVRLQVQVELPD